MPTHVVDKRESRATVWGVQHQTEEETLMAHRMANLNVFARAEELASPQLLRARGLPPRPRTARPLRSLRGPPGGRRMGASESGFTLLFEALLMALVSEMPVRAVADLVGEHDPRIWRVLHHYVALARAADFSATTRVGLDETSAGGATTTSACSSTSTGRGCCSPPPAATPPRSAAFGPTWSPMPVSPRRSVSWSWTCLQRSLAGPPATSPRRP